MGTFHSPIEIAAGPAGPFEAFDALVDSGVMYTLVPQATLRPLGVEPIERRTFVIADGSRVEREVGEALIRIDGRVRTSVVVFGDDGAEPLLGAVTLDEFVALDRYRRTAARADAGLPRGCRAGGRR